MALPLADYALIGDTQTAALVGRDGSIDWLCFPRFDSGACFSALLGTPDHGRWLVAPEGPVLERQWRYQPGTLILETEYRTSTGRVRVTDFMPPRETKPDVVRIVEGLEGQVQMETELIIRFDYGLQVPWIQRKGQSLTAVAGPDGLVLRTPVEVEGEALRHRASFAVSAGQRVPFVLTWFPSHEPPPRAVDPPQALKDTVGYWTEWVANLRGVAGPYKDRLVRSLITLKALTYAPTGGIMAAPTTSLPETFGGVRNWDYRFCWVRDATLTLNALMEAGAVDEAEAWRGWLLRAAAGSPDQLQIMYGPAGERLLPEFELDWLPGYQASRPVRVGNAASQQFQLDVYGELMDAMARARAHGIDEDSASWDLQRAVLAFLEDHWSDPDNGLWEVRGPRRHFVHSRVMAWVAFDRAVQAIEKHGLSGPLERWKGLRQTIHDEVCTQGFSTAKGAFSQYYGTDELDASLLMIPLVGFLPADDPRVVGTVEAIQKELMHDGFVLRYRTHGEVDGLPGGEGAFLACTFWLVDNLALMGRIDDAMAIFERLSSLCNDLGLLAEEYDVAHGCMVGNFPQAFSHVGLVNSAFNLTRASRARSGRRRSPT
jgi:GH15 family glucan-1,4-alpha-glucosidase